VRRRGLVTVALVGIAALLAACTGASRPQAGDTLTAGAGTPETTAAPAATDTAAPGTDAAGQAATNAGASGKTATSAKKAGAGSGSAASAGSAAGAPGATTATGAGAPGTPGTPGAPTTLFTAKEDTVGLTADKIVLCAHAALTYGAAFHTGVDDLKVYFDAINAEQNGIFGRKVEITYENDDYKPDTAVQAANACKAKNPFILLGGIGFDQIPAVRTWAESNRMLYLHHTATVNGSEGKQFSFSALPSTERMGEVFGELAVARLKGKKIGIIKRDSPNWEPGVDAFKKIAAKHGVKIVAERAVQASKGNYVDDILEMKNQGAEVVWAWENALGATEIVKQAKAQQYNPTWLVFPFNLTSQTLGDDALNPKMIGVAMFTAYSNGDYTGSFAPYADDIKEFERQYRVYKPDADLTSLGGDLLFLNWTAMKALHLQLLECGKDCTRNKFIDVMKGYNKRPFPAACQIDFTRGNGHLGGYAVDIMETYKAPSGKVNWRNTDTCVEHLI
jgi:ABC-type branched-subunit amino acid transport system substrate-binding protein